MSLTKKNEAQNFMEISTDYAISPVCHPIHGTITPPGSKSISNRAFICAAMAKEPTRLVGLLDSDDTRVMRISLERLGINVLSDPNTPENVVVRHTSESWRPIESPFVNSAELLNLTLNTISPRTELFVGNSGTTIRFLLAMLATGHGNYHLDGVPRMRERPLGDLLNSLRSLGVTVSSDRKKTIENSIAKSQDSSDEYAPISLNANGLRGGAVRIRGDISSQFLSALLMAAPYTIDKPLEISVIPNESGETTLVSKPYVAMTLAVMRSFGIDTKAPTDLTHFTIPQGRYHCKEYVIEPDASAASYFLAAAAITGGQITIPGLSNRSLQGDIYFANVLEKMGCTLQWAPQKITLFGPQPGMQLYGIDIDMSDISDTAQTLCVVAIFAKTPTRIRGVRNMRYKETDRIAATARELRRLGVHVTEFDDGLQIEPLPRNRYNNLEKAIQNSVTIQTYDDHRMAMSFALAGLRIPGIKIANPHCVSKTYPNYFEDLTRVCKEN